MKAKKSLGQNFLRDPKILRKIADFAEIKKDETILEIGPGEGTLTEILLEQAGKVIAVEKDERLAENLKEKFKEVKKEKLEIINADILDYKLEANSYKLIGNIPYYITGEIFRKFLESSNQPSSFTFVIQREVAERILARDGKESVLSISIKAYGEPKYGGLIKAGSFSPSPKVDSAIISVQNINKKRFEEIASPQPLSKGEGQNPPSWGGQPARLASQLEAGGGGANELEKRFFQILKKGFGHKRKLLTRNLGVSPEFLEKLGIPAKARAENLTVDDWFKLAAEMSP